MSVQIEKVTLIHPEKYTERLQHLEAVYPECLPVYNIPKALTGDDVTKPRWWVRSPNSYALYCNVKNFVENDLDAVTLLLEDDCRFAEDFEPRLNEFLAEVPDDWDLLNLGCGHCYTTMYPPVQVSEHCLKANYMIFCHAIVYNPKSKGKILRVLDTDGWENDYTPEHEYDQAYGFASLRGKIKVYSPIRNICGQFGEKSTLRNSEGGSVSFMNMFQYMDMEGNIVKVQP